MQKLGRRDTYTPTDAPQVRGNCDPALNNPSGVMDSVPGSKTLPNNSDVDLLRKEKRDLRVPVYVVSMRGEPLMPTTPRKARIFLKRKNAKVVKRDPFTIQLNYPTGETRQEVVLGIDAGYSRIGFSATTETKELISGEVELRKDVSKKLMEKRAYRRNRRNRLWYRKQRFLNRKKKEGWLAPSIEHKFQSHVRLIEFLKRILPVSKLVIEVATFDTQKMQDPEISGVEYQQGTLQGYEVREYLLEKWARKCAYCNMKGIPLEIEHIVPKSRGGTDRVSNLAIACHGCNQKKDKMTAEEFGFPKIQERAREPLKAPAFMNVVRWKLVNHFNCEWTYGSKTKHDRTKLDLEKSHVNDAFVIANGGYQERVVLLSFKHVRRNNRSVQLNRKGFKPSIRRKRHNLQPNDLVRFEGSVCKVMGMFSYGKWVRLKDSAGNVFNSNARNVELIRYGKGFQSV